MVACAATSGLTGAEPAARHPMWKYPPELPGAEIQTYKRVGDVELRIWTFAPADIAEGERRPAIVFFFGGGWRAGTPGQFYRHCRYLADRGMVAITADYRVHSRHQVLAPACVADAKSAIRWIRAHADSLQIDPNRIVAAGGSAGGHLAACTGIVQGFDDPQDDQSISAVPNAMALFNPAVLLARSPGRNQLPEEKLLDLAQRTDNQAAALSPALNVRGELPPTIIFHGTADEAVPFWTVEEFSEAMRAAGNRCELKAYPGAPHGFFNTGRGGSPERQDQEHRLFNSTIRQLDDFLKSLGYISGPARVSGISDPSIQLRGSLQNCRHRFEHDHVGHVAFLGGSITEMNGYRPMVADWLRQRFPETRFEFTNAGISSTCSTTGAFRLSSDVLHNGPIDLLFVEYAVNDDQDAMHLRDAAIRGMEGIIRQLRRHNPHADIVMTHFVNPPMLELLQQGQEPVSIDAHQTVARHYEISTVHLAREVARRISSGTLDWKQYGGTHPKPAGNQICADMIATLLTAAWDQPRPDGLLAHRWPASAVDRFNYEEGRFLGLSVVKISHGWMISRPDWENLPGQKRSRFTDRELLHGSLPGAAFEARFEGHAIGAYILAGPDAGQLTYSIDDSEPQTVELYHRFSKGLHYPRTVMFATELPAGRHTLRVEIGRQHHSESLGNAARILELVAN